MSEETLSIRLKQPHAPLPSPAAPAGVAPHQAKAPVDPNDPMERARRRAEELRQHSSFDMGSDKFAFDPSIVPPGWCYEWRMQTVTGMEFQEYQVYLAQRGWEAVPASRHPEMMPIGYTGVTIDRGGQRLMERPLVISQEATEREQKMARQQVRSNEEKVTGQPAGDSSPFDPATRSVGGKPLGIKKSYSSEELEIPKA